MLFALLLITLAGQSPAAAISGRVTEQASGRPLPRMVVTLVTADPSKQVEAVTDADGRYEFTGLAPGRYAIAAAHDEHRSTYLRYWFGETDPAPPFGGPPRLNIELKTGDARSGVDIALSRALAIEGRVSDPWDAPLPAVEVTVTRADGRLLFMRPAYSDDLGAYRVYGLAPGRYRVCARVEGHPDDVPTTDGSRLVSTCHPASVVEAGAGDVALASQDASGIDIRIQRIGSRSISGFVVNATGAPVEGAAISARALDASVSGGSVNLTSRRGAFVFKDLVPGRYMVEASIGASPGDPSAPAPGMELGYVAADVATSDATDVAVMLAKPTKVAGTITFEGTPVTRRETLRMVVHGRQADDRDLFERPPSAPVNDDLTFELGGLSRLPIAFAIQGQPEGWTLKSVRYEGRDITYVPTDFASASSTSRLELVLTNRVARPSARVTDAQGAPVTAYHIVTIPADPARWKLWTAIVPDTPSADGALKLGAMLPGDYFIAAFSDEDFILLIRDRGRLDGMASIGTKVTLETGDTRTVELHLARLPEKR
jgi:Carboxypeptidase regulatory-like domain